LVFTVSILNQITLYFLSNLDIAKQKISNARVALTYAILVSGSFYLGSLISEGILILWPGMGSFFYMTLLFQNSFLILFILSYFFAKVEMKLKSSIELILFGLFQGILAINWIIIFNMLNVLNFFSIILILLIETCLTVKTVKYLNSLFLEEKQPNFLVRVFALITLCLYFESSLLIYGYLIEFTGIGFTGSVLVSQLFFFTLTILDIYSFKKIKRKYAQLIHTLSYFLISLMILIVLNHLVVAYPILLSLEIALFTLMQFYTNYSLNRTLTQFNPENIENFVKWSSYIKHGLGIFFYSNLSFLIFQALNLSNIEFQLIFLILSITIYFFMIIDSYLMKFLGKFANYIKIISWVSIMTFSAISLVLGSIYINILNLFMINLTLLMETFLSMRLIKYLDTLYFKEKHPTFLSKAISSIIILLYFEISLLLFGYLIIFIGIFESILISQLLFCVFTLLDIYSLKKIKKGYAQAIHTISYFIISITIFIILIGSVAQYPLLLSVGVLILIIMQFYSNYSLFASLNQLFPGKKELLDKRKSNITRYLGIGFYVSLSLILLQPLILSQVEPQLILLSLSLMVHGLMIIDTFLMKFLGKYANYFKVISWVLLMTFTTTYLIVLYIAYLILFLLSSIPLIIFVLLSETAYLFKILDFWKFVESKKERIKFYLISISYLNFIAWPIYFVTFNLIQVLNLLTFSIFILFLFTYVDKYIGNFKEKLLTSLRKISFLTIGVLLSTDVFILLGLIPNSTLVLNLSVALLVFLIFLGIIVKPFRKHSLIAFTFWLALFSLLSSIAYQVSLFWVYPVSILSLAFLIYPFVFLLEELRELFNKLIDFLSKFFIKVKLLITNFFKTIFFYVKTYYKVFWFLFSTSTSIFFGILLSEVGPLPIHLNWFHDILLTFAIFGFLYLVIPAAKSLDPDVIFKRRIIRLSIGWGSVIAVLFMVIPIDGYIATTFISIAVVGTIILVYIGRKEEREKISIKWRFYT
ncbi:hypothetical protein LCGC14_1715040, partial [marine sediment metagenome]